jgi:hypothetical protein
VLAITGWGITMNTDGLVEGTAVGAIAGVSVGSVVFVFSTFEDAIAGATIYTIVNGILVGMIVGVIVVVSVSGIDDPPGAFHGAVVGAFVGGIAGAIFGEIGYILVNFVEYNELADTPITVTPLFVVLIFTIIGCIVCISANIKRGKINYRHRLTLVGSAHIPASPERA